MCQVEPRDMDCSDYTLLVNILVQVMTKCVLVLTY